MTIARISGIAHFTRALPSLFIAVHLIAGAVLIAGCIHPQDGFQVEDDEVPLRILITRDMGTLVLQDHDHQVPTGTSVLDALHEVAHVETAHDGEFVLAIDGEHSGHPERTTDWFYHVNGRLGATGAAHQIVQQDDVIVWDHRPWNHTMTLPYLLNGLEWPPVLDEILTPQQLNEQSDHPHIFLRLDDDLLHVQDPWARTAHTIEPPWLVVHVTRHENTPRLLVAVSDETALTQLDTWNTQTPSGLGLVITPDTTIPIPASGTS